MKFSKVISGMAAAAIAASMMTVAANATNWANAGYADNDPATVTIVSTDDSKVVFTATADGVAAKCRITLNELLENPDDAANIKSASWTVTYDGFTPDMDAANGVGGGTYAGTCNSVSYWISPDYNEDGSAYWANSSYSVEDSVKYLLPSQVPTADAEFVFMDWSNYNLLSNNITISISDLKFFDEAGNEIAQKAYAGAAEAAPAADADTTAAATGNTAAAAIAAVMAVAGVAAVAAKKRK